MQVPRYFDSVVHEISYYLITIQVELREIACYVRVGGLACPTFGFTQRWLKQGRPLPLALTVSSSASPAYTFTIAYYIVYDTVLSSINLYKNNYLELLYF